MMSTRVPLKSKAQPASKNAQLDQSVVLNDMHFPKHTAPTATDGAFRMKVKTKFPRSPNTHKHNYSAVNLRPPDVISADCENEVSEVERRGCDPTTVKRKFRDKKPKASINNDLLADAVVGDTQAEIPATDIQPSKLNGKDRDHDSSLNSKAPKGRNGTRGFHEISNKKRRVSTSNQFSQEILDRGQLWGDEYASHFSSDSDAAVSQATHLDRATQRERRRVQNERLRRTVFVGNLPSVVSRRQLKQLFNRTLRSDPRCAAEGCYVESVRFRGVIPSTGGSGRLARKRAVVQGEHSVGVSETLLAYIVLSSKVGIPAALTLNGHWLSADTQTKSLSEDPAVVKGGNNEGDIGPGRFIRVDAAKEDKSTIKHECCVFLGNLAFDIVEDEVRNTFSRFGQIDNVRLIRDRQTGAVKGIGYVQFKDVSAVSLAIRASGSISIRNRPVRVQECKPTGSKNTKRKRSDKWKPKNLSVQITTLKTGKPRTNSISSIEAQRKLHSKLDHTGRIKGITLPSNLRGSLRERYLNKRLIKKRKRQLRRQGISGNQACATVMFGESKATRKHLDRKMKSTTGDMTKLKKGKSFKNKEL